MAIEKINTPEQPALHLITDSRERFIKACAAEPLLEPEEEAGLFKLYSAGRYAQSVLEEGQGGALQVELHQVNQQGLQAFNRLVKANTRLVIKLANKYNRKGPPADFDTLLSEGMLTLIRAVEYFDYTRGNRFSTFGYIIIEQRIAATKRIGGLSFTPGQRKFSQIKEFRAYHNQLTQLLGHHPTGYELTIHGDYSEKQILEFLLLTKPLASLDAPIHNGEDDFNLGDSVMDTSQSLSSEEYEARRMVEVILNTVGDILTPEEADLFLRHIGIKTGKHIPLSIIAREKGVSRQAVHARYKIIVSKIKNAIAKQIHSGKVN